MAGDHDSTRKLARDAETGRVDLHNARTADLAHADFRLLADAHGAKEFAVLFIQKRTADPAALPGAHGDERELFKRDRLRFLRHP